ncbi:nucleolin-like isoform X3 [Gracilinanus agilis]|uniref:nucleolin-like isoform X3 n=1 Tax=Gracilinanus agilis TaxID=191870 RepID=UPI001CFDEB4E|nr:nucleolin-like isoform X3 [Gracilinanus agilis]
MEVWTCVAPEPLDPPSNSPYSDLRFLLPVSLLILFLALVAAEDHLVSTLKTLYEVEAPLSNKRTLQIQGESEGNTLESEFQDEPDSDSSEDQGGEDLGDEDEDENAPEEEEEEDSPFQKAGGL